LSVHVTTSSKVFQHGLQYYCDGSLKEGKETKAQYVIQQ
jgi:hypothetical protein